MATFITVLIVIVAILLILVVLIQNSKGGGLSNTFGGGANQLIGVKKTGDALEKLTWGLAIGVLFLSLIVNASIGTTEAGADDPRSPNVQRFQEQSGPSMSLPQSEDGAEGSGETFEGIEGDDAENMLDTE